MVFGGEADERFDWTCSTCRSPNARRPGSSTEWTSPPPRSAGTSPARWTRRLRHRRYNPKSVTTLTSRCAVVRRRRQRRHRQCDQQQDPRRRRRSVQRRPARHRHLRHNGARARSRATRSPTTRRAASSPRTTARSRSSDKTVDDVALGKVDFIAQNGIQDQLRHGRHCQGQHHQRPRLHADGLDRHGSARSTRPAASRRRPTTSSTTR